MMPEPHILYREWLTLQTQLLWCYDHPVQSAGHAHQTHAFYMSAWLMRKGSCIVTSQGEQCKASVGQWLIPNPGRRVQTFSSDAEILSMAFQCRWPTGEHLFHNGLSVVFDAKDFPFLEKTALSLVAVIQECLPDGRWQILNEKMAMSSFLKVEEILPQWIKGWARVMIHLGLRPTHLDGVDARILKAVRIVQGLPLDIPLRTDTLAEQVGLSKSQFERLYRKQIHCTPRQHFERLRLEYARNSLLVPQARIKEIALDLGFDALSHFSHWFHRLAGCSPRDFKNNGPLQ